MSAQKKGGNAVGATRKSLLGRASTGSIGYGAAKVKSHVSLDVNKMTVTPYLWHNNSGLYCRNVFARNHLSPDDEKIVEGVA